MKLTTLGTSHGDPTVSRFNTSNSLQAGENLYIIDAGVPVNALYIRKHTNDFSKLRAIFLTHTHDDHMGGLPSLIKSMIRYPQEGQHTRIFLPEDVEKPLRAWVETMRMVHYSRFEELVSFQLVKEGKIYEDEEVTVYAIGTHHIPEDTPEPITFGYRFESKGKSLVYTGDLWRDFHDFPTQHLLEQGADMLVCESTHCPVEMVVEKVQNLPVKKLVFNHVGNPQQTPEGAKQWLEHFADAGFPCTIAADGDTFEVE